MVLDGIISLQTNATVVNQMTRHEVIDVHEIKTILYLGIKGAAKVESAGIERKALEHTVDTLV